MIDKLIDTHIHTNFSPDADKDATFENYISKASELGLKELVFTDHVDFDSVHPIFLDMINYDSYIPMFKKIKEESEIKLKLGVEIGYQPHVVEEINSFLLKYPFEHIILSVHYVDKQDMYTKEFFKDKTTYEAFYRYFETVLEAVSKMDNFDVVGHLDYITRYSEVQDYNYNDYKDIIDQILNVIIKKDKGIEINTSGYTTDDRMYPKIEIIQRFLELGGKTITLSSDSHRPSELGRYFDVVEKEFKIKSLDF